MGGATQLMTRIPLVARVATLLRKHGLLVYDPDVYMVIFSGIALSRGFIYAFPDPALDAPSVPQGGISLLPDELTYLYGGLWLIIGAIGVVSGIRHVWTNIARTMLGSMFFVWSVIYVFGAITAGHWVNRTLWGAAALFLLCLWGTAHRPKKKPVYVYVLVPNGLINELAHDGALTTEELVETLHQHVTTPERLLMSIQSMKSEDG